MITTQDLQQANQTVAKARNAVPFDQTAYDDAHAAYMALIERWRVEGMESANEARRELAKDPGIRRLFEE